MTRNAGSAERYVRLGAVVAAAAAATQTSGWQRVALGSVAAAGLATGLSRYCPVNPAVGREAFHNGQSPLEQGQRDTELRRDASMRSALGTAFTTASGPPAAIPGTDVFGAPRRGGPGDDRPRPISRTQNPQGSRTRSSRKMRRPLPFGWVARGTRALLAACQPTTNAIAGPLYRAGAPWRSRLCPIGERGEPLSITGTITAWPDCRPVANATLDIWQTNARGLYSNLLGRENPSESGAFNLRGRTSSDGEGRYHFESIVPGRYPLFWPLTRPRHIHLVVSHPRYEELTTQIYFEGDKYNRSDPWWKAPLTIRLQPHVDLQSGRAGYRGAFDIVLQPRSG